ncbi:Kinesin- motor protein [Malassezia sp. CBS 17886]|nr:Kinesin- motor protein [Malassezia sp. CBS 17886]
MDDDAARGARGVYAPRAPTAPEYAPLYSLYGHTRAVAALAFSYDGKHLASAGADGLVQVWETRSARLRQTLEGHTHGVNAVCWTRDNGYVASASDDRSVRLWDARTGRVMRVWNGHTSYVMCVACHPLGTLLATGGFDETIRLWDIQRGTCHRVLAAHAEAVAGVDFSQDGTMMVSCSFDGLVRLWDTSEGHCLRTLQHSDKAPVSSVQFSPSSLQLLVTTLDSVVRLWDIANSRVLKTYAGHTNAKYAIVAAFVWNTSLREDARMLQHDANPTAEHARADALPHVFVACGSEDRKVYVWDLQTKRIVQTLDGHRDAVTAIAVHPSLPLLASGALEQDGHIRATDDARRRPDAGGHNTRAAGDANIKVVVRVRCVRDALCDLMHRGAAHSGGEAVLDADGPRGAQVRVRDVSAAGVRAATTFGPDERAFAKTYTFDHVFGVDADQGMVYQDAVAGVLDEVLQGYNCTVFAYGQTGTGKTYTMEGELASNMGTYAAEAGVIPRTLFRLFHVLETRGDEYGVKMSMVELYNEELRDLLHGDADTSGTRAEPLRMFEDPRGRGIMLQGLEEVPILSAEHGVRLLRQGSQARHVAATRCNDTSSRSHSVCTLTVYVKETGARGEEVMRTGKLNLVDLAGSENIARSGAEKGRAREAGLINQSLLTLGRVINALVEGNSHIPYRESRLTRLLQDSLGGRTKTCIIATVSDERGNMDETLSTLDYALRAKSIKNRPELNQRMTRAALIREYVSENDRLRSDLHATRTKSGIYVSEENWAARESEQAALARHAEDSRRAAEVAQSRLASMREQLEQNARHMARREADAEAAEAAHQARHAELQCARSEAAALSRALDEETHLHRARAQSEQRLHRHAVQLQATVTDATRDVHGLFAKLQRRAAADGEAHAALASFHAHLRAVAADVDARARTAADERAALTNQSREALDEIQRTLTADHAVLRDAVREHLGALQRELGDAHADSSAHAAAVDEGITALREQLTQRLEARLCALRTDVGTSVASLQTGLAEHARGTQTRLDTLASSVRDHASAFTERSAALRQHTRGAVDRELQRATRQTEWLSRLLQVEKEKTGGLRDALLAAVDAFADDRERRLGHAVGAAQADLGTARRSLGELVSGTEQRAAVLADGSVELALAAEAAAEAGAHDVDPCALLATHAETVAGRLDEEVAVHGDLQRALVLASAHTQQRAQDTADGIVGVVDAAGARASDHWARHGVSRSADTQHYDGSHSALGDALAQVRRLHDAFAPLATDAFGSVPATGETPRRRHWTSPAPLEPVPTERADALRARIRPQRAGE